MAWDCKRSSSPWHQCLLQGGKRVARWLTGARRRLLLNHAPVNTPTHIMGLLQNSTRGLGQVSVRGLSLVPKPPTRMMAFSCAGVVLVMVSEFD